MFRGRHPRNRGASSSNRGRGGRNPKTTSGPRGLFADGIWHCDCAPRLPAEHFKVKKEGKNQGRWFYTCQNAEPRRCGFFLWDEDAKVREEGAVLSNSRTEPARQAGWDAGRSTGGDVGGKGLFAGLGSAATGQRGGREVDSETESSASTEQPRDQSSSWSSAAGTKRNAITAGFEDDDDDDLFGWPLTAQEEQELSNAADMAPETPRKALKTGVYATPAETSERKKRRLPWLEDQTINAPTTPVTPARHLDSYFDTPSKPPTAACALTLSAVNGPATPSLPPPTLATAKSPSPPSRHRDALSNPADSSSTLTSEVLTILSSVSIPPSTVSSLRSALSKHDLRTQGIAKGRDISRLALKAKDAKIAELQARIASLEAEREVEKAIMRERRRGVRFDA